MLKRNVMRVTRALALGLTFVGAGQCSALAQNRAAQVDAQAPGFYRMKLGAFQVTALFDGTKILPVLGLLRNIATPQVQQALSRAAEKDDVALSFNAFLVHTGQRLVLVDAGAGAMFGPELGKLAGNLAAGGYRPEQVDEVLITHFHADHVGGLVANGRRVFPNAVVRAHRAEADYWLSADNAQAAAEPLRPFFKSAAEALAPYLAAGAFKPFDSAFEIAPGIRAVPTIGHTPGHTVYVVESEGKRLVIWGDVVHIGAVQLAHVDAGFRADSDVLQATRARKSLFDSLAADDTLVAAAHFSFPGIGRLRTQGAGYQWWPLPYGSTP